MIEGLIALSIVLAIVTVVGHGIWVGIAWLVRGDAHRPGALRGFCPRCGLPLSSPNCGACDWPLPPNVSTRRPAAALDALVAQIERAKAAEIISPQTADRLLQSVAAEREQLLLGKRTAPVLRPTP